MKAVPFLLFLLLPLGGLAQQELSVDQRNFLYTKASMAENRCYGYWNAQRLWWDLETYNERVGGSSMPGSIWYWRLERQRFRDLYRGWMSRQGGSRKECPVSYTMLPVLYNRPVPAIRKYLARHHWQLDTIYSDTLNRQDRTEVYVYQGNAAADGLPAYTFMLQYELPGGDHKQELLKRLAAGGPKSSIMTTAVRELVHNQYRATPLDAAGQATAFRFEKDGYKFLLGDIPTGATTADRYYMVTFLF